MVVFPTFNQVTQQRQIIVFGLTAPRFGRKRFVLRPGSIKVVVITNWARWKRTDELPILGLSRTKRHSFHLFFVFIRVGRVPLTSAERRPGRRVPRTSRLDLEA